MFDYLVGIFSFGENFDPKESKITIEAGFDTLKTAKEYGKFIYYNRHIWYGAVVIITPNGTRLYLDSRGRGKNFKLFEEACFYHAEEDEHKRMCDYIASDHVKIIRNKK